MLILFYELLFHCILLCVCLDYAISKLYLEAGWLLEATLITWMRMVSFAAPITWQDLRCWLIRLRLQRVDRKLVGLKLLWSLLCSEVFLVCNWCRRRLLEEVSTLADRTCRLVSLQMRWVPHQLSLVRLVDDAVSSWQFLLRYSSFSVTFLLFVLHSWHLDCLSC